MGIDKRSYAVLTVLQRRPRAPRQFRRGTYLLPSLFTLGNMFCGYACIIYAMRGEYGTAAPFIGIAMVLDMLDGRIARLTKTSSAFGVEFDSLADVISFGVAPAVLALAWGLTPMGRIGWVTGFIFVSATAIRLARFNIQGSAATDKRYFAGMPCPPAAGVVAATVFAWPYGLTAWHGVLALPLLLVPALLMVSTIRYRSFKTFDLGKRRSYRNLIVLVLVMAAVAAEPRGTLVIMAYAYLLSGVAGYAWMRFHRRPEAPAPAHEEGVRDQGSGVREMTR
ncbi:MAG: CDP-diacylglycerol--serine O-phosphatidyltransferase [Luteitalea sp.]|nr:CDP-diacylglycerol--serine O-phosphatidyltransferase [Luteitalea sp.]